MVVDLRWIAWCAIIACAIVLAGCRSPAPPTGTMASEDTLATKAMLDSAKQLLGLGHFERAETLVRSVLEISPAPSAHHTVALGMQGTIWRRHNQPDSSIVYHRKAVEQAAVLGDKQQEASARMNLGGALGSIGDQVAALEQHLLALRLKEELGDSIGVGRSLNNLGILHLGTGDTALAESSFRQALQIQRRMGDSLSWHRSLINLAVVEIELGRADIALAHLREALRVRPERNLMFSEAGILANMALAYEAL